MYETIIECILVAHGRLCVQPLFWEILSYLFQVKSRSKKAMGTPSEGISRNFEPPRLKVIG